MRVNRDDVKYQIAQKLFEYYVMNDKHVAMLESGKIDHSESDRNSQF